MYYKINDNKLIIAPIYDKNLGIANGTLNRNWLSENQFKYYTIDEILDLYQNNIINELPVEVELEVSYLNFRNVCENIKNYFELTEFKGWYDELIDLFTLDKYRTTKSNSLIAQFHEISMRCDILGAKVGLDHLGWWIECWKIYDNDFTLTALSDNSSVCLNKHGNPDEIVLKYQTNKNSTWQNYTIGSTINLSKQNDWVKFRGTTETFSQSTNDYYNFELYGSVAASNNIMSLVNYRNSLLEYMFVYLFENFNLNFNLNETETDTGITDASKLLLPVLTLSEGCYGAMFLANQNLIFAPKLPAVKLSKGCYGAMFAGCKNLTGIIELPANELVDGCYDNMFNGTKINGLKVNFLEWHENATLKWVENVETDGTFICPKELPIEIGCDRIPEEWARSPLTFVAIENNSSIKITKLGSPVVDGLKYRLGTSGEWLTYNIDTIINLDQYEAIQFKNCNNKLSINDENYVTFVMTGKISSSGNIQSMLNYSEDCSEYCYFAMFFECTSLILAPELPVVTLSSYCYSHMFGGCTGLTMAPELPATALAEGCYRYMFGRCTGLTMAPELPVITLADYCYDRMFCNCTNLSGIIELPANTLTYMCYDRMFLNTKITGLNVNFTKWRDDATYDWVKGIENFGKFNGPAELPIEYGSSRIPTSWEEDANEDKLNYLTFTAKESGSTISLNGYGTFESQNIMYRTSIYDEWISYNLGSIITLKYVGDYVQFKNTEDNLSYGNECYCKFQIDGKINASGNIQSMVNHSDICQSYCYYKLFYGCSGLVSAPELPATTLADYCYCDMFYNCTSLTVAPELPATTLADYCYQNIFGGCTGLTTAPNLPATSLAEGCYSSMFNNCTSLTKVPKLSASTLADECYSSMFSGCTNLTTAPELPATALTEGCYSSMFSGCTSLIRAPELPATILVNRCYNSMFYGCKKLNYIKVNFTSWGSDNTSYWVYGVSSSGTFVRQNELPEEYGYSRIPESWECMSKEFGGGIFECIYCGAPRAYTLSRVCQFCCPSKAGGHDYAGFNICGICGHKKQEKPDYFCSKCKNERVEKEGDLCDKCKLKCYMCKQNPVENEGDWCSSCEEKYCKVHCELLDENGKCSKCDPKCRHCKMHSVENEGDLCVNCEKLFCPIHKDVLLDENGNCSKCGPACKKCGQNPVKNDGDLCDNCKPKCKRCGVESVENEGDLCASCFGRVSNGSCSASGCGNNTLGSEYCYCEEHCPNIDKHNNLPDSSICDECGFTGSGNIG